MPEVEDDEPIDENDFLDVEFDGEPIDEEEIPLPQPDVPILQVQPEEEEEDDEMPSLSPPATGFGDAIPEEEDDEDFNFGISPEDLEKYSQYNSAVNEEAKANADSDLNFVKEEPVIFESKREKARNKQKELRQNLKETLEKPQEIDSELDSEKDLEDAHFSSTYQNETDGWNRRGKSEKTKAKEARQAKGQSYLFQYMATEANTNPLEIVETSTGRADVEGIKQIKPEFLGEIESIFNPKTNSPNKVQLRSSKASLERKPK